MKLSFLLRSICILGFLLCASPVWAAGSGAFRIELPDADAMGRGSAFVGQADTAAAVYYNPAGMTQVQGNQIKLGFSTISPKVDYNGNATNSAAKMERKTFYVPHFYYVTDLGTERFAFGLGAGSHWGSGTSWKDSSPFRYIATESILENQDYYLTAAYKISDTWSFAASLDYTDSKLSKSKKLNQGTGDGNFQVKGKDTAFGYRLATHYKLSDQHKFGLMYRSKMKLKYEGDVHLNDLNTTPVITIPGVGVLSYSTIFGGSSYSTPITANLTLPQSVVAGYSYQPDDRWTFNFDVEWMDWSSVKEDKLEYTQETNAARLAVLNTGNPENKDWTSAISFGTGAEYKATNYLRLRGGYYFHESPIKEATFHPNLPDANSHSLTAGVGYDLSQSMSVDLAYSLMIFEDRNIGNEVGSVLGENVNGEYEETIDLFLVSLNYNF